MSTQSQANTSPSDSEIAVFLLSKGPQLSEREREFVDAIIRLAFKDLTLKQREFLHCLFHKFGGRIT
jgi:hypothetical protein